MTDFELQGLGSKFQNPKTFNPRRLTRGERGTVALDCRAVAAQQPRQRGKRGLGDSGGPGGAAPLCQGTAQALEKEPLGAARRRGGRVCTLPSRLPLASGRFAVLGWTRAIGQRLGPGCCRSCGRGLRRGSGVAAASQVRKLGRSDLRQACNMRDTTA